MKTRTPTTLDLALWPYTNGGDDAQPPAPPPRIARAAEADDPGGWQAVATRHPELARDLIALVRDVEALRAELAETTARFEEQLTAIAAAVRALGNATPNDALGCEQGSSIADLLRTVLSPSDDAGESFARARGQLLELAAHVTDLWRGARCGARAIDELGCAAALQRGWLPAERPIDVGGVQIAGCCRPAADCCGDWWDCSRLADGRVLVVVADAMGSGAAAALLIGVLKGAHEVAVRFAARGCFSLTGLLSAFNRVVYGAARGRATVTCSAAIIDPARGTLTFAGAGHPLPMHARYCELRGRQVRCLPARGAVLGASPAQRYAESTIAVRPGDAIVWCTDGVLDLESARGRRFGARRLSQAIAAAPSLAPDHLRASVRETLECFARASASAGSDDMALVVAGIGAPAPEHLPRTRRSGYRFGRSMRSKASP